VSGRWSAGAGAFLGINYSGMHDSTVCLADAYGRPVYAVGEERFSRVKQDGRFPHRALATVELGEVAAIGVPYLESSPGPAETDPVFRPLMHPVPDRPVLPFPPEWRERLEALGRPLLFFDHHEMHAYTGFVLSGYPEALALTFDYGAYNCALTAGAFHLRAGTATRLAGAAMNEYHALASLYTDATALLGFTPCKHEGKVTGLAAHGRPGADRRRALWEVHRSIRDADHLLYDWVGFLDGDTPPFYEPNRHLVQRYRERFPYSDADLARAAQDLLEERLTVVAEWLADTCGRDLPLVLAGGVFANVRANLALARVGFRKVFVAPPMGDDGLCIGAAAAAGHQAGARRPGAPARPPARSSAMALGPLPAEPGAAEPLLAALGVRHRTLTRPEEELADALADDLTVALVRGRQEFGPRALGRRSVLSAARDPRVNARLNARLRRTEFMPFAPILRAERVAEVFDLDGIASDVTDCLPFMTMCLPVRPETARLAPAVVHVDGTARPQVVTADDDPFLHRLLEEYERRTGVPVLINTSFNLHDEPLVSTLEDALAAFLTAELDLLCLDGRIGVALADNPRLAAAARLLRRDNGAAAARRTALNHAFGRRMVDGPGRFSELSDTSALVGR
jgi:carbamoyltransferase